MAPFLALLLLVLAGCSSPAPSPSAEPSARSRAHRPSAASEAPVAALREVRPLPPSTHPAPARLVAIGDVHGDLEAFRAALRLAGAIDASNHWSGGALWVVQTGDVLDRGDEEDEILAQIAQLEREAAEAGGRFVALHGNHELMNVQGDFRYVTPDGFADFDEHARGASPGASAIPREMRGRAVAFRPGGRYARELAERNTVVVIGGTVFVHGGLAERHAARGLDVINEEMRAFMLGESPLSEALRGEDSPVWHRAFALGNDPAMCAELAASLERAHATRMVVGHTVQDEGISSACEGRVWRIDVGLARHYGGPLEVLEIVGDHATVLRAERRAPM